jgi:hypothetical protein
MWGSCGVVFTACQLRYPTRTGVADRTTGPQVAGPTPTSTKPDADQYSTLILEADLPVEAC